MKNGNIVQEKSYAFALRMVRLYQQMTEKNKEFILSRQAVRSGTSIGANGEEAIGGQSGRDFAAKMSIAYKEARETHYWLCLLRDSGYLDEKAADGHLDACKELMRLTGSITKTMKKKNGKE
jgi:four helix bundle protein